MIEPQILAYNARRILLILKNIIDDSTPLVGYPVLIGSRAAKWHVSSFREPNDWDLVATPSQSTLFINKVNESGATFKSIKLIHYPGGGLKLVGGCTEPSTNRKSVDFDIELVSDKMDLRNMKSNEALNKKEIYESDNENESNVENDNENGSNVENDNENDGNVEDDMSEDDTSEDEDEINKIEFERFKDVQPKISALMILELCRNIEDKIMFPLLPNFPCIVAPLKVLEALKTSHIYWPTDFHKNIADLHFLRILSVSMIQPLCSPQCDEQLKLC